MKITIERGNKKYRVHLRSDCTKKCSFGRFNKSKPCPEQCFLPRWFTDVIDKLMRLGCYPFLEEIKDEN